MTDLFASISLSFADGATVDEDALCREMHSLGLSQDQTSTEGHPVRMPDFTFVGRMPSEDREGTHRSLYRGLNAALKRLEVHGRFFILVSPDVDWICCHF